MLRWGGAKMLVSKLIESQAADSRLGTYDYLNILQLLPPQEQGSVIETLKEHGKCIPTLVLLIPPKVDQSLQAMLLDYIKPHLSDIITDNSSLSRVLTAFYRDDTRDETPAKIRSLQEEVITAIKAKLPNIIKNIGDLNHLFGAIQVKYGELPKRALAHILKEANIQWEHTSKWYPESLKKHLKTDREVLIDKLASQYTPQPEAEAGAGAGAGGGAGAGAGAGAGGGV